MRIGRAFASVFVAACGGSEGPHRDAAVHDAISIAPDARAADASPLDAALPDAMPPDAGPPDAGPVFYHIGNDVEFGKNSDQGADYLLGTRIIVAAPATLDALAVIGKTTGALVTLALYTESAGAPHTLLAETDPTPLVLGALEIPLAGGPVPLPAGSYWFMGVYSANAQIGLRHLPSSTVRYVAHDFDTPLPALFPPHGSIMGQEFNYYLVVH